MAKARCSGVLQCCLLAVLCSSLAWAETGKPLAPGDLLDQSNWQKAEGLLPPEVLEHFKRGDYASRIVDWPPGLQRWGKDFLEGTEINRSRLALDEHGTIIETANGRPPSYIIGFPFPDVDAQDPQAPVKILWNFFYQYWYNGNSHHLVPISWVGNRGLDREAIQEVYFLYYDGQPRSLVPSQNPQNFLVQFLAVATSPADLYGTAALSWRYRSADSRDAVWAYVPALRRVRAVSPANRSDGFLGSDMSQDDGPFFDGKPQDFTWKLVGEAETLRYSDPFSLKGDIHFSALPGGGWRLARRDDPFAGYQVPDWKGVPWAPVGMVLTKRPHWIIEGIPKDRYYLFGKIQLYIDKETYNGSWNRKFDWKGELVNVYLSSITINGTPDGENYFMAAPAAVLIAENVKAGRATMASQPPHGVKDPFYDLRVRAEPDFFNYQTLLRFGK